MKYHVTIGERVHEVELVERLGELVIAVDGRPMDLHYEEADRLGQVVLLHEGRSYAISIEGDGREVGVTLAGHYYGLRLEDERERAANLAEREAGHDGGVIESVMPGVVVEVLVAEGQRVEPGQPLLILEAMKMQNEIRAQGGGTVRTLHVEPGRAVGAGERLETLDQVHE